MGPGQPDSAQVLVAPAGADANTPQSQLVQDVLTSALGMALVACALFIFRLRSRALELRQMRAERDEARREVARLGAELESRRSEPGANALAEENQALRRRYRKLEERARRLQAHNERDALTGLLDRRAFQDLLDREFRRALRDNNPVTLVGWALDESFLVDGRPGAELVERVMKGVSGIVAGVCRRGGDQGARIGPTSFAAVLPGTPLSGAALLAERVRKAVLEMDVPAERAGSGRRLTVSAGLLDPQPALGPAPDDALAALEAACEEAARQGGNRTVKGNSAAASPRRAG